MCGPHPSGSRTVEGRGACDNRPAMHADDFRRLALGFHDAVEAAHMGHPDFRANGRIFATLDAREEYGVVMLAPAEQKAMMRESAAFEPAAGAWGRQGCTKIRLAAADRATVRAALLLAWQSAMARPRRKPASKSATAKRTPAARRPRKNPRT